MPTEIRMLTSVSGVDFTVASGDVTDRFSDAEAERLIAQGEAERVGKKRAKASGAGSESAGAESQAEDAGGA